MLDNFIPHKGEVVREWAAANNVELAYTPHHASWLNRDRGTVPGAALLHLAGIDHPDHATQAKLIRRYIA